MLGSIRDQIERYFNFTLVGTIRFAAVDVAITRHILASAMPAGGIDNGRQRGNHAYENGTR
jgi:hypothetical protein